MEVWKDVPNYEGLYMVSNLGRIKRMFKSNNEVQNLEWVTASENVQHCIETGRNSKTREVNQYSKNMDLIATWKSIREAGKRLGISEHNICYCCSGGLKTAGGFVWRYKGANI